MFADDAPNPTQPLRNRHLTAPSEQPRRRMRVVLLASFGMSFALLLPPNLVSWVVHDEGFVVTGAAMILDGQLPFRDFLSFYGPAQYYAVAGLYWLFGQDLLVSRIEHTLFLAALVPLALLAATTTDEEPHGSISWILAAILVAAALICKPNANYPAIPATVALLLAAHFLGRRSAERGSKDTLIASCLIGTAGLFRWDFGLFGLFAGAVSVTLPYFASRTSWRHALVDGFALTLPALAIMLMVYAPLLLIADPGRWYREVLHYSLFDFAKYRNIGFLRPTFGILARSVLGGSVSGLYEALFRILFVVMPITLMAISLVLVISRAWRGRSDGAVLRSLVRPAFLALLCGALFNQMRVRPSLWQGFPAFVVALPLIPFVLRAAGTDFLRDRPGARLAARCFGVAMASALLTRSVDALLTAVDHRAASLRVEKATWIKVAPLASATGRDYAEVIGEIARRTKPGDYIYSGLKDPSRTFIGDSLLYFLADRRPATRFVELDPGVSDTLEAQREICDGLLRHKVRLVVLWDHPGYEANLSSRSNGIYHLTDCIENHFRLTTTRGRYAFWEPR